MAAAIGSAWRRSWKTPTLNIDIKAELQRILNATPILDSEPLWINSYQKLLVVPFFYHILSYPNRRDTQRASFSRFSTLLAFGPPTQKLSLQPLSPVIYYFILQD